MAACENGCLECPFVSRNGALEAMKGQKTQSFDIGETKYYPEIHDGVRLDRKGNKIHCSLTRGGTVTKKEHGLIFDD